jgi:hypothetical protein
VNKEVREEKNEVGNLLHGLKPAEAPPNFDFGLKAKIAHGAPKNSPVPRFVRYAIPFALVLVVGAVLVLNSLYFVGERSVADIPSVPEQKVETPQPTVENNPPQGLSAPAELALKSASVAPRPAVPSGRKFGSPRAQQKPLEGSRGGSYVAAQRIQEPIYPKGLNTPQTGTIGVNEAFVILGIEATFSEENWKVISVKEKSIAERAGIKPGDEPDAFDDQALSGTASFKTPFSVKTISLIRDGKPMKISLH